jgi:hypothetical protein
MSANPKKYLAYLLRLWQVDENGRPVWRVSLEDPRTGERRGFASLEMLMKFLRDQTGKEQEPQFNLTRNQAD